LPDLCSVSLVAQTLGESQFQNVASRKLYWLTQDVRRIVSASAHWSFNSFFPLPLSVTECDFAVKRRSSKSLCNVPCRSRTSCLKDRFFAEQSKGDCIPLTGQSYHRKQMVGYYGKKQEHVPPPRSDLFKACLWSTVGNESLITFYRRQQQQS